MELVNFLRTVITTETGYFCLAHVGIKNSEEDTKADWKEEFFSWPDDLDKIISRIGSLGNKTNIYFSPYLFTDPKSSKSNAIVGRTIVADLDEASVLTLPLKPTILVETSPDRHQGYWILKDELDREEHEALSKKLTYSIPRCDKNGWFLGKKVRVPNTYNHKYITGPKYIRVVDQNNDKFTAGQIDSLYVNTEIIDNTSLDETDLTWAEKCIQFEIGPQEMLAAVRASNPGMSRLYAQYTQLATDRSTALWGLMTALFRAGLRKEYVFYIAYNGVNNKFKDLRFGGIKELAKDVLRADLAVKSQAPNIKSKIVATRRLSGSATEKSTAIAETILNYLETIGTFLHTDDDAAWFIREDNGKAIFLSPHSEPLETMMDTLFGLNQSTKEYFYVVRTIIAKTMESSINGMVANLSYYSKDDQEFYMHTGKKDVLLVKSTGIERVVNGYNGIIFPWSPSLTSTISPKYQALDADWDEILFGDCLNNVIDLEKEHAQAILKVWLLSVLLRDGLASRPHLALFGNPGSGKSTLFRRVYTLLYGRGRGINSVTNENDFDYAVSTDPLVVLDNVDSAPRWLPDRLAVMAAPNEVLKRKLYTDTGVIRLKRNAMLGITAHAPKFVREDIADRLLLFNFERLSSFKSETEILDRIVDLRNALWGSILQDIRIVLNTKIPKRGYPQFRVEDFAIYGYWIASALDIGDQFYEGIETIRKSQKGFVLDADAILVEALDRWIRKATGNQPEFTPFKTSGQLWLQLSANSSDMENFEKKYKNSVALGNKLWNMLDALRESYEVEWRQGNHRGSREYSFKILVNDSNDNSNNEEVRSGTT